MNLNGCVATLNFKGRQVPQWVADFVVQAAARDGGFMRHQLEDELLKGNSATRCDAYALTTRVVQAARRLKVIRYDGESWRLT